ncbi:MAG: cobalt transporter [Oscillospiraceae bacterium]|nr:cobalt transporter [Oscillospiraceae bacterium]
MHIHHDMTGGDHSHDHSHTHTHEHTHDGVTHTHEHAHEHTHEHAHPHDHEHLHGEGHEHTHSHDCGSNCGSCGGCQHTPMEELMALMKYMANHNAAHAKELADLAVQLQKAGSHVAYEQVMAAVSDFETGNLRLRAVLASLEN